MVRLFRSQVFDEQGHVLTALKVDAKHVRREHARDGTLLAPPAGDLDDTSLHLRQEIFERKPEALVFTVHWLSFS